MNVSGDIYVISYSGQSPNRIAVKTLTISAAGAISSVIDTLSLESSTGLYSTPTLVSGDVYAVVYRTGLGSPGFVTTFTISSAGSFSAVLDTLEVDAANLDVYPDIITVPDSTVVCVTYGDPNLDGIAKTAKISVSAIYPIDALTRVTSITYRYNRGVYSTEVGLGGVISDFDIPVVDDAPPKSYLSKLPRDSELPPTPKPGEEEGLPVPSLEETEQERRARLLGEIGIGTPAPPVEGETEQERRARLLEPIVRTTPTPNLTRRVIESEQEKRARLLGELGIGG